MHPHSWSRVGGWTLVFVLCVGAATLAQTPRRYGAESPESAIAALNKAIAEDDFLAATALFSPDSVKDIALRFTTLVLKFVEVLNPDTDKPLTPSSDDERLVVRRAEYKRVADLARESFAPYELDGAVGKGPEDADVQRAIQAAIDRRESSRLIITAVETLDKIYQARGLKPIPRPPSPMKARQPTNYQVAGDRATAQDGDDTVHFVRLADRWYIVCPPRPKGAGDRF